MPVAAALYGVLLGIGFTTFVLSFGVWALAGVSLAVGDPTLGLVLGAGFGLGRAVPIVALAPLAGGRAGIRATELMCERPGVYLGLRRGDAAALAVAALALIVVPGSVSAAGTNIAHATDPSATADSLLFQRLGGPAVMSRGGPEIPLPGSHPAIGGRYVATVQGDAIRLFDRNTLAPVARSPRRAPTRSGSRRLARLSRVHRRRRGHLHPLYRQPRGSRPAPPGRLAGRGWAAEPPGGGRQRLALRDRHPARQPGGAEADGHTQAPRAGALAEAPALRSVGEGAFVRVRTSRRPPQPPDGPPPKGARRRSRAPLAGPLEGSGVVERPRQLVAYATILQPSAGNPDATIVGVGRKHPKRFHQRGPRGGGNHRF